MRFQGEDWREQGGKACLPLRDRFESQLCRVTVGSLAPPEPLLLRLQSGEMGLGDPGTLPAFAFEDLPETPEAERAGPERRWPGGRASRLQGRGRMGGLSGSSWARVGLPLPAHHAQHHFSSQPLRRDQSNSADGAGRESGFLGRAGALGREPRTGALSLLCC